MNRTTRKAFRQAATRHGRQKSGLSLCEGWRCCGELLARRPEWVESVAVSEHVDVPSDMRDRFASLSVNPETLPEGEFRELAATETPQGICVLFRPPSLTSSPPDPAEPFILVLDGVADPGNLGTIVRTAWAVGLASVWLTRGTVDPYAPKAVRAGMGAQFAVALRQFEGLSEVRNTLREAEWGPLWVTVPTGGMSAFSADFDFRHAAVVIGGESGGVSDVEEGRRVSLPMPGDAESLNAAQAATVFLFEAVRRGILGTG